MISKHSAGVQHTSKSVLLRTLQKNRGRNSNERNQNKHQVALKHKTQHMLMLIDIVEQLMVLPSVCDTCLWCNQSPAS